MSEAPDTTGLSMIRCRSATFTAINALRGAFRRPIGNHHRRNAHTAGRKVTQNGLMTMGPSPAATQHKSSSTALWTS